MDKNLSVRVRDYRISVAVVQEMLTKGLVSEEEYAIMCTILVGAFGLKNSTIFSDFDLITAENDGNITH